MSFIVRLYRSLFGRRKPRPASRLKCGMCGDPNRAESAYCRTCGGISVEVEDPPY